MSVGLDMIAVPGDTSVSTLAAIIADEMAIGMINKKTTAVRIIPAPGTKVGDMVEFGGLLGSAPVMPVRNFPARRFLSVAVAGYRPHSVLNQLTGPVAAEPGVSTLVCKGLLQGAGPFETLGGRAGLIRKSQ
ncbi:MAG: DUF711 family protein [Syntrophotaleaceae bacterium]